MQIKTVELKAVKYSDWNSHETNCFEAKLYVNGKLAGYVDNAGRGGNTRIQLDHKQTLTYADLSEFGRQEISNSDSEYKEFLDTSDLSELYMDYLFEKWFAEKGIRRDCKKNICFTLHSKPDSYRLITKTGNHFDDQKIVASKILQYGKDWNELLNEKYDKDFARSE